MPFRDSLRPSSQGFLIPILVASRPAAADASGTDQGSSNPVKQLSLEQLGSIEVTSVTRQPEEVWNTAAAIYVITNDEIRRSGVTTIPDALRLALAWK